MGTGVRLVPLVLAAVAMASATAATGSRVAQSATPRQALHLGFRTVPPRLITQAPPKYTAGARAQGLQGSVEVEAFVDTDGYVVDPRVTRSLDEIDGLDAEAIAAVEQWRFEPGGLTMRGGATQLRLVVVRLVRPVVVRLEVPFVIPALGSAAAPTDPVRWTWPAPPADPPEAFTEGVYSPDATGIKRPTSIWSVGANYTEEALRDRIQGNVRVEAVVMPDGAVGAARIIRSLDAVRGLDAEALATARMWRFSPGTLDGRPVPTRVALDMSFRLH
jgi:TonB family protein